MNNQATLEKITQLRLWGIKDAFTALMQNPAQMTNDEFIAHLIEAEWIDRHNRRIERLIRNARFRYTAHPIEIEYGPGRGLDKNVFLLPQRLLLCQTKREHPAYRAHWCRQILCRLRLGALGLYDGL